MLANIWKTVKNTFFPFHRHEISLLFPLFLLFFFTSFIYNLLRPLKISLVVTASNSGADIIPFLKVWAILPSAVLFAFIYTKLSQRLERGQVFFYILSIFLGYFTLFYFMYPHRELVELDLIAERLNALLPIGWHGLVSVVQHWDLSLFYVMSEIWGNMMLTVMAWGLANEIVSISQAKRFYAILAVGADSAGIFSGQYANLIKADSWEQTLSLTMLSTLGIGAIVGLLYAYLNNKVKSQANNLELKLDATAGGKPDLINDKACVKQEEKHTKEQFANAETAKGTKLSFWDSLYFVFKSKHLLYIAIIVVSYNMAFNLFDVLWIGQLKQQFTSKNDLNSYMNDLTSMTGILSASIAFFCSGNIIRKLGWRYAAYITPVVFVLTGLGFFSSLLFASPGLANVIHSILGNPLNNVVIFYGTLQYCLTRSSKYTVFDVSKEMAFLPLPGCEKRQGKVIIDAVFSRASKSGSSIVFQVLLLTCSQLIFTTPYVVAILVMVVVAWLYAIYQLNRILTDKVDAADLQFSSSASSKTKLLGKSGVY